MPVMTPRSEKQILVIHPGALGDVLQAVPALRALRAAGGRLSFAGQPRLAGFLTDAGAAQAALGFDALRLEALFTDEPLPPSLSERLAHFDHVVSWFGSQTAVYRRRLSEIVGDSVIAPPAPKPGEPITVWRHLLETLGLPGAEVRTAPLEPPEPWSAAARRALEELSARRDRPLLVIHPGAGAVWKRVPLPLLAEAIQSATRDRVVEILIHQGPADAEAAGQLATVLGAQVLRLIEPELPLLAGILRGATAYIGSDSGVSHLAAAVGAPSVILFPPSTRAQWEPWSATAVAIEVKDGAAWVEEAGEAARSRLGAGPAPRMG
jgi:heptosyltransferase-3